MQGYPALEGFGITLIRNHAVDAIPRKKNEILKNSFPESISYKCLLLFSILLKMFISYNLVYCT